MPKLFSIVLVIAIAFATDFDAFDSTDCSGTKLGKIALTAVTCGTVATSTGNGATCQVEKDCVKNFSGTLTLEDAVACGRDTGPTQNVGYKVTESSGSFTVDYYAFTNCSGSPIVGASTTYNPSTCTAIKNDALNATCYSVKGSSAASALEWLF